MVGWEPLWVRVQFHSPPAPSGLRFTDPGNAPSCMPRALIPTHTFLRSPTPAKEPSQEGHVKTIKKTFSADSTHHHSPHHPPPTTHTVRFSPLPALEPCTYPAPFAHAHAGPLGDEAQKDVLWGGQLLLTDEGLKQIHTAHMGFLAAGADVIGTNSYNFSIEKLRNTDFFVRDPVTQ